MIQDLIDFTVANQCSKNWCLSVVAFIQERNKMEQERMMKWFEFSHLPEHLQSVSAKFYELACSLCALVEPGPERTASLRKLLEAKDAAVRAKLNPGG